MEMNRKPDFVAELECKIADSCKMLSPLATFAASECDNT
jgi:hypothetical protein